MYVAEALRRSSIVGEWLAFAFQVLIAISVEVGDDLGRGLVSQHGTLEGRENALRLVAFEASHGLWVEPAWQLFFRHPWHVLMFTLTWIDIAHVMNFVYVFGHVFVTLSVAIWVYVYHRSRFVLFRNIVILTNVLALLIYETFPVAPPRLIKAGLWFDHHRFIFQDTLYGVFSSTSHVVGTSTAYNEFSAMPSVHMAWALIAGAALLTMARSNGLRAAGIVYPFMMLLAVVVTGNHFLLDAVGAAAVVGAAAGLAVVIEQIKLKVLRPVRNRCHAAVPS